MNTTIARAIHTVYIINITSGRVVKIDAINGQSCCNFTANLVLSIFLVATLLGVHEVTHAYLAHIGGL